MAALYVVLGILGGLCIATAPVGGESSIEVAGHTFTRPGKLSLLSRGWLFLVGLALLCAAVVLPSVKFGGGSSAHVQSGPSGNTRPTAITGGGPEPATPKYLRYLQPQGGDVPTRGDTQIGNQDFPYSIFYNNIPGNQSNASACQNSSYPTCQATDYNIANTRYHQLKAMLGVAGCSGDTAHWSVTVDGVVIRSGTVTVGSSPQAVSVAIPRGRVLELLVGTESSFSGAACGGVNIIWGNAKLS